MRTFLRTSGRLLALPLVLLTTASATSQTFSIAPNEARQRAMRNVAAVSLNRSPKAMLAEHRALSAALAALKGQRKGVVDAYVVVAGLDSDGVFSREAREAARVLSRRYDAAGRTIVLTSGAGDGEAVASPGNLAVALARVAELMDLGEDAVVLYTTSHGSAQEGIAYRDVARGAGAIRPERLAGLLNDAGLINRMVIVSACYSGVFVPRIATDTSVVITAAAKDRSSFGCGAGNDWTYFGDALLNRAMRKAQPIASAFAEAEASVSGWENAGRLEPSRPQISVGSRATRWLSPLEARTPKQASAPVGRSPATPAQTAQ